MSKRTLKDDLIELSDQSMEKANEQSSLIYRPEMKDIANLNNLKIAIFILVAVLSAVIFTMVEESHETKNLAGISSSYSKIVDIDVAATDLFAYTLHQEYQTSTDVGGHSVTESSDSGNSTGGNTFNNQTVYLFLQASTNNSWYTLAMLDTTSSKERLDITHYPHWLNYRLLLASNSTSPIGIDFELLYLSRLARYQEIFAAVILIGMYVLIILELTHRTVAAMIAAFVSLGVLSQLHQRPSFEEVISWIDFETVGLLFGMMIMVGIFSNTGFFEWAAVKAYKVSKGNLWHLTLLLCVFTGVVSAFLDNVTTILLVGPVTIKLCKVLDVDPKIMILAEVIFSNVGGTATVIGDPPNIIIANHPAIMPYINFATFSLHVAPAIVLSGVALVLYLWKFYSTTLHRDPNVHIQQEITIWKKTLLKFKNDDPDNPEEAQVFTYLESFIANLEKQLAKRKQSVLSIDELEHRHKIKDFGLLIKSLVVLFIVVVMFFMHSLLGIKLSLAWIAVIGAMLLIIASGITDVEEILEKVEFGTLMFFAALFILMRSLEELGLIEWIGTQLASIISSVPEGKVRLLVAVLLLMWVSAFASAFIDNIPYTATLAPIVARLGTTANLGLPITPLIWALSLGTCLGGNGTIIGASANVVAVGLCEQQNCNITFLDFLKMGMPIMILTNAVSCVYVVVFHVVIPWY